jgi:DNA modification methylase
MRHTIMSKLAKIPVVTVDQHPDAPDWWRDGIICGDCRESLRALPDASIHMAITSPPYNVGLKYDGHHDKMSYDQYLEWLLPTWRELHRVLVAGGRFALNIAPTSIKDFRPIHYDMAAQLRSLGFIMRTEILWYKQVMRRRTAWGSWKSPANPHIVPSWEYVLVFSKGTWSLPGDKKNADITGDEFLKFSDGFWPIHPETRGRQPFMESLYKPRRGKNAPKEKDDGHPAPFPEELIYRLMKFYSFRGNTILDPFGGTGTVAAVAARTRRHFVHLELSKRYCEVTAARVADAIKKSRQDTMNLETKRKQPVHRKQDNTSNEPKKRGRPRKTPSPDATVPLPMSP